MSDLFYLGEERIVVIALDKGRLTLLDFLLDLGAGFLAEQGKGQRGAKIADGDVEPLAEVEHLEQDLEADPRGSGRTVPFLSRLAILIVVQPVRREEAETIDVELHRAALLRRARFTGFPEFVGDVTVEYAIQQAITQIVGGVNHGAEIEVHHHIAVRRGSSSKR